MSLKHEAGTPGHTITPPENIESVPVVREYFAVSNGKAVHLIASDSAHAIVQAEAILGEKNVQLYFKECVGAIMTQSDPFSGAIAEARKEIGDWEP